MHLTYLISCAFFVGALSGPLKQRGPTPATVDFANDTGTPHQLASGILYGIPNNPDQIPVSIPSFWSNVWIFSNQARPLSSRELVSTIKERVEFNFLPFRREEYKVKTYSFWIIFHSLRRESTEPLCVCPVKLSHYKRVWCQFHLPHP